MIQTETGNRIGTIWLNRPEKRNALHPQLVEELKTALDDFTHDANVKVILLRGRGDAFCAGADLSVIQNMQKASYAENLEDSRKLAELFQKIYECPKVVVAAVHGHAIAGGCGLASVCDISIASEKALFGYTETRIGFVPAIVGRFLIRKTGLTHAKKLLLTGSLIPADEACRIGLISETVPHNGFEEVIDKITDTLINKTSAEALTATKELLNTVDDMTFAQALEHAIKTNAEARSTDDCKKGIAAFLNKERPEW